MKERFVEQHSYCYNSNLHSLPLAAFWHVKGPAYELFLFSISQLVTPHSVELSSTSPVFIAIVMSAYEKFIVH